MSEWFKTLQTEQTTFATVISHNRQASRIGPFLPKIRVSCIFGRVLYGVCSNKEVYLQGTFQPIKTLDNRSMSLFLFSLAINYLACLV